VGPALEPMTESQVVLSIPAHGDLAQVRSADVLEYFVRLKASFIRVTLASALCELAGTALPEAEANAPAYSHVRVALAGIDGASDRDAINWLWWFALALAADVGYALQADSCISCGSDERPHRWFSTAEGGPVCAACPGQHMKPWMADTQETLRWLLHSEPERIEERRIGKSVNREMRSLIENYYRFHVPGFRSMKALDMLADTADAEAAAGER